MLMPNSFSASYLTLTSDMTQLAKIQLVQNLLQSIQPNGFQTDLLTVTSSLLCYNSLLNSQFGDLTRLSHCDNAAMNVRETSDLRFLNSNTFVSNSSLQVQNQPCSFTTSSNNDGSVQDKQLGSSYVPDDFFIPPLVPASPYNKATTQIDPSISYSTISAVNSSSLTMNSIVSSPSEPWDVSHFLESDNDDIDWKDILE